MFNFSLSHEQKQMFIESEENRLKGVSEIKALAEEFNLINSKCMKGFFDLREVHKRDFNEIKEMASIFKKAVSLEYGTLSNWSEFKHFTGYPIRALEILEKIYLGEYYHKMFLFDHWFKNYKHIFLKDANKEKQEYIINNYIYIIEHNEIKKKRFFDIDYISKDEINKYDENEKTQIKNLNQIINFNNKKELDRLNELKHQARQETKAKRNEKRKLLASNIIDKITNGDR